MIEKNTSSGIMSYRDRVYIVSDIILKLIEYGKMNQTAVTTFCGLNISKHRSILDKLEHNGLIERTEQALGKRSITIYQCTPKGVEFCKNILEPYEKMFPRTEKFHSSKATFVRDNLSLGQTEVNFYELSPVC
jgi:predicted transcriptional regulator